MQSGCLSILGGKEIVQETGAEFHRVINRALDRLERSVRLKLKRMTRLEEKTQTKEPCKRLLQREVAPRLFALQSQCCSRGGR
jgi:hypothetical protein